MTESPRDADAAAVTACTHGDGAGLEQLYDRYASACLHHARTVLIDPHHAEDAVQEAYLELWRNADRFDAGRCSARSWLLMLTHRRAVDRVRSEQRRQTCLLAAEHDVADDRRGPAEHAVVALAGDHARRALAALPEPKREVLVLAYWGGYTQREIAALTSTPIGTVKTRMRSALLDLGAQLGSDVPLEGAVAASA